MPPYEYTLAKRRRVLSGNRLGHVPNTVNKAFTMCSLRISMATNMLAEAAVDASLYVRRFVPTMFWPISATRTARLQMKASVKMRL